MFERKLMTIQSPVGPRVNPFGMPIRAENMSLELLLKVRDELQGYPHLSRQMYTLIDFFSNEAYYRRFQLGLKGWGKTFSTLLALSYVVEKKPEFKPLMLIFDRLHMKLVMYDPLRFASEKAWGERLEFYRKSFDEVFEEASCIIVDDIHYLFESLAEKPSFFPSFLNLLEKVHRKSVERTKVLLISEVPLFSYAELFRNKRFDFLITKFGLVPKVLLRRNDQNREWYEKLDPLAFREVPYFFFADWFGCLRFYGIELDEFWAQTLFNIEASPRAIVKIAKLLEHEKLVTSESLFKLSMERLRQQGTEPRELEAYEILYQTIPELEIGEMVAYERFEMRLDQERVDDIRELIKNSMVYIARCLLEDYPTLEKASVWIPPTDYYNPKVGKTIHRKGYRCRLDKFNTPIHVVRRALETLGRIDLKSLIHKYLKDSAEFSKESVEQLTSDLLAVVSLNVRTHLLEDFVKMKSSQYAIFEETVNRLGLKARGVLKLYHHDGRLYIPFEKAFSYYLRERPSTEIISRKTVWKEI